MQLTLSNTSEIHLGSSDDEKELSPDVLSPSKSDSAITSRKHSPKSPESPKKKGRKSPKSPKKKKKKHKVKFQSKTPDPDSSRSSKSRGYAHTINTLSPTSNSSNASDQSDSESPPTSPSPIQLLKRRSKSYDDRVLVSSSSSPNDDNTVSPYNLRPRSRSNIPPHRRRNSHRGHHSESTVNRRYRSQSVATPPSSDYKVPRKLGPREIGRIHYPEATIYDDSNYHHFLKEKIDFRARTESFMKRKARHPVEKGLSVQQIGKPSNWSKPEFYEEEMDKLESHFAAIRGRKDWESWENFYWGDKPISSRNPKLDKLKGTHLPPGRNLSAYGAPSDWEPIDFEYHVSSGGFLDEKLWFEGSKVQHEHGLSKMINVLPPMSQLELAKMPAPTGYQSKINFLKKLREIVTQQVRRINTEDRLFRKLTHHRLRSIAMKATSASSSSSSSYTDLSEVANELGFGTELEPAQINAIANSMDLSPIDVEFKEEENVNGYHFQSSSGGSNKSRNSGKSVKFALFEPETGNDSVGVSSYGGSQNSIVMHTIPDDDDLAEMDEEVIEQQYHQLLQKKKSRLGQSQRKLLTIHSVNKLNNMIDGIASTKTDSV